MAGILHLASGTSGAIGVNSASNFLFAAGNLGTITTEARAQITWRTAGAFSQFYCRVSANTLSTATATVTFRKNTAAGNQTISISAGTTGEFEDNVNTDATSAGDLVNYRIATAAGGTGNMTVTVLSTQFAATSNTVTRLIAGGTAGRSTASTTAWGALQGSCATSFSSTENKSQFKSKGAGTYQNLQMFVSVNTRVDTNTLRIRKNTANGNQVISLLTLTTGVFEDNTNTDTVVVGDLVNYQLITGTDGAHSLTVESYSVEYLSTANLAVAITGTKSTVDNANQTVYDAIAGVRTSNATESQVSAMANFAYTASNLATFLASNGVSATSTINFRKNAGNGNQTVSLTASTTGYFEDTVNSDAVLASDEINYQLVLGATGTSMQPGLFSHLITVAASSVLIGFLSNTEIPRFDRDLWAAVPYN